jgi:GTP diphosphokinase / guanosine-3',5'-bis(diphosphate) 3'-diphosphatase
LLHDKYKAIPGRFKDYISAPKPNGYQSLHTSLVGPFGNRMEVQIRTQEMHDIAENGVAAHWVYNHVKGPGQGQDLQADSSLNVLETAAGAGGKMAGKVAKFGKMLKLGGKLVPASKLADEASSDEASRPAANPYRWLKGLVEQLQGLDDPTEFYENAKLELFSENVFTMTPRGDVIQLPRGATPLDFAYAVHSKVGNHAVSAKVNGSVVPLRRQLENGDVVEIVTSPHQHPNPGWRELAVSSRARSAINRYLRQQERDEQVKLGREILEKAARRDDWKWDIKQLQSIVKKITVGQLHEVDDIFAALGQGRLFPRQIHDLLYPNSHPAPAPDMLRGTPEKPKKKGTLTAAGDEGRDSKVALDGVLAGMSVHYAKCCSPLPGEEIVGIINTGRGISVHMRTCKNLEALADQPDRWLPVRWSVAAEQGELRSFVCRLRFVLRPDTGALANITSTIANADANIIEITTEHRSSDAMTVRCEMEIKNKDHLNRLIANLSALKPILRVEKIYGWA